MANEGKREEQLTQEIMRRMTELYEQLGREPEKLNEAMQTEIASILSGQGKSKKSSSEIDKTDGKFKLTEKGKEAMLQVMNGIDPKQIAKTLGMSKSGVFAVMQREGIMTKTQIIGLIEIGKSNEEIHVEGKWTIEAIENVRKELREKQERKKTAKRESDRKRKEKMKAERQPRIEAKQQIKRRREQDFREALALGLSTETIAIQFNFKDISTVRVKKSKEGLLGRREIIALLPYKSNAEIAEMAGIENVDIIEQIRQEEDANVQRLIEEQANKHQAKIDMAQAIEEGKNRKLRIALAEGKSLGEITSILGVKDIGTVSDRKQRIGALTRRDIIALLPEKSNEEMLEITRLDDIKIIEEIRQNEDQRRAQEEKDRQEKLKQKEIESNEREQAFRIALAQGRSRDEVAKKFGIEKANTVTMRKRRIGALDRKEIIALLPYKADTEIAEMARITDISVIQKIRQEEMPETVKKIEESIVKPNIHVRIPEGAKRRFRLIISKQDEATFLKLAQSLTSVAEIARQLGMTEEQVRDALEDYNIFTREEVIEWLPYKSDMQITIMGDLRDYAVVAKVRKKEMERQLTEENEGEVVIEESPEMQARKEETMLFRMAQNYMPVEKIGSAFNMSEYKVILKIRKFGLYTRAEVERMIENGETSNEEIAGEFGNINAVARIRRKVQRRELMIRSIPADKQELIRRKIATGVAVSAISYDTRVKSPIIIAIQEKWKRDKDLEIPIEKRRVKLKIDWMLLEGGIRNLIRNTPQREKEQIQHMIEEILVMYEGLLTQRHCAYIAYAYMKMDKPTEGIEFAEDYLGLENCSEVGVKDKINEILEQELSQERAHTEGDTRKSTSLLLDWEESSR